MQRVELIVETNSGCLRGVSRGPVSVFRGVPYGQAKRFEAPVMPKPWTGVRLALTDGPASPQVIMSDHGDTAMSWYSDIGPTSEVCQNLNVFTPACDGAERPVMVWLHGGGWSSFSGSAPGTNGTNLAITEDLVVVTINHRLGALGFLALESDDPMIAGSGNAGLLDIVLALAWVRDNIAAFGGSARNVTIFGQSGGAAKVAALMALPAARGLFHKAIIQSMSGGLQVATRAEALRRTRTLTDKLGLDPADLRSLRQVPLARFLAATATLPRSFCPTEGDLGDPFLLRAPLGAAGIPLLAGCTETEASYYLRSHPKVFDIDLVSVVDRVAGFLDLSEEAARQIVTTYADACHGATPADLLIAIASDQIFKRNTYHAVAAQAEQAPAYGYYFTRRTPVNDGRLGAPHCSELPFIFGTARLAEALVGTGPDIAGTTKMMMSCWGAFARTGTPATPHLGAWRPYSDPDRPVMCLGPNPGIAPDPGAGRRAALDPLPHFAYGHRRMPVHSD